MSYSIHHDLEINAPIREVYEVVCDPVHLINWWPERCTGIPQTGEIYNFQFTEAYNWFGEVIRAIPNEAFHIKMTQSDEDWNPTSFGFDLESHQNKVLVKFWHVGWLNCNAHFRRSSFCWAILLQGLKNYVEKGIIIPFEERE